MTTIKDLAKAAGVSVTTVSRALNGYSDVNEETRRKIKEIAEAMKYRPNVVARSLVTKRTKSIGVILSEINREGAKDALAFETLCGINDRAVELDYDILLFSTNPKKQLSKSYADLCRERNVDGAILSGLRVNDPYLHEVLNHPDFPCVLIDIPVESDNIGHVTTDNVRGATAAVEHLIQLGHRDIAMINGHDEAAVSRDRKEGYRKALEQAGIPFREELVFNGQFKEAGGFEAMNEILIKRPNVTAVFSASDLMVLGALKALEKVGRKVPESMSIVGYDDIAIASHCHPPLTTIRQDRYEMGYQAAQLLVDLLDGRHVKRKIVLHSELIVRHSTAAPPRE